MTTKLKIHLLAQPDILSCARTELTLIQGLRALELEERIQLVDTVDAADFVILSVLFFAIRPAPHDKADLRTHQTHLSNVLRAIEKIPREKLVIVDVSDTSDIYVPLDRAKYTFKKSVYDSVPDGDFIRRIPAECFGRVNPWEYAALIPEYRPFPTIEKDIDLFCPVRRNPVHYHRNAVLDTLKGMRELDDYRTIIGAVSAGGLQNNKSEPVFDDVYFNHLARAKIVVLCAPVWQSTVSLWESLCAASLVICDKLNFDWLQPRILGGKHLLEYSDLGELKEHILYALDKDNAADVQQIRYKGFGWAMAHRPVNRVRYLINKLDTARSSRRVSER